ncbi:MAG: hypothetical protein KKE30_03285, partial [Gammaproteobacteria bacterium]|nr:hypothetical protein [Gammaproteobacteria bacterium]MBU1556893.1 hypothetical protein [Gammaproteobacteria bacterium]
MSWPTTRRWLKRSLSWLNRTLLLPCTLLIAVLITLLYTPAGLTFSLWLAQHTVAGLSVERSEGSVLGGNSLYEVRWQDDTVKLTLAQSTLQINNRCFLRLTLCVEQLSLQGLQLDLATSTPAQQTEPPHAAVRVWLPFAIDITQLQLNDASVRVAGSELTWQQFSTAAQLWGNKVQLIQPHWQQVNLMLAGTAVSQTDTAFAYQVPELADFRLPLNVFIDRFKLTDFTLQQPQPQTLSELSFSLQLQPEQINLTQLDITHPLATLHASAQLQPNGNYPLQADIRLLLQDTKLAGQQLHVSLDGDLSNLTVQAEASQLLAL